VGVQAGIDFFFDTGSEAVTTDHHHRIEVVGLGAVIFALGRSK
jgi:hypothetical protein